MKKLSSLLLAFAVGFFCQPLSVSAASVDSQRLYEEFLNALRLQQDQPMENGMAQEMAPVPTGQYSLSGKVTGKDGKYYLTTDEKPSRVLRVYGQKASKEIMQAVLYSKVQLIGEKAYFKGKEVGISAQQVVVLEMTGKPKMEAKQPDMKPMWTPPAQEEMVFTGTIETAEGKVFLVVMEGKKKITRPLLNSQDWKKAFDYAYKGEVQVKGYLTKGGSIRYSDIY